MSNIFYTFAPSFVPGTLARSGDVNTQFGLVQTAFDKLTTGNSTLGVDSGTVNSVVLTMATTRTAYVDGDEVAFRPAVQNTGATTIKVDALASISLTRFNGTPLQNADLLVGSWYTARYLASANVFEITSPAAYTLAAGVVSAAAPTNKVGLVAAGGVSNNVLPIDATFAIDQAIIPTWTGTHTFSGAGITTTFAGKVAIGTPSSGTALAVSGVSLGTAQTWADGTRTAQLNFIAGSTQLSVTSAHALDLVTGGAARLSIANAGLVTITNGLTVSGARVTASAGLTVSGATFISRGITDNATAAALTLAAGGLVTASAGLTVSGAAFTSRGITDNATAAALTLAAGGAVTLAPSSGAALTVTGVALSVPASITSNGSTPGSYDIIDLIGNATNGNGIRFLEGATTRAIIGYGSTSVTGATNADLCLESVSGNVIIGRSNGSAIGTTFGPNGNVTINAPSSGEAFNVNSLANSLGVRVTAPNSTSQSFGLATLAGTNSSDYSFIAESAAGTPYFKVRGDGIVQAADQGGTLQDVGWRDLPVNGQAGAYQLVFADRGKMVEAPGTVTIPANASVAFPLGTTIVIVNTAGGAISIAITTDTLVLAGTSSTGTRTLAVNGLATIVKTGTAFWLISGSGLS